MQIDSRSDWTSGRIPITMNTPIDPKPPETGRNPFRTNVFNGEGKLAKEEMIDS